MRGFESYYACVQLDFSINNIPLLQNYTDLVKKFFKLHSASFATHLMFNMVSSLLICIVIKTKTKIIQHITIN